MTIGVTAALACLSVLIASPASAAGAATGAMTPELQHRIQHLVDEYQKNNNVVGVSVAVVTPDPNGSDPVTTTFAAGLPEIGSSTPVDASTQFELGSETKVFTADLLAYLIAAGQVSLDDPVQMYAPPGYTVPDWTDPQTGTTTAITLQDLATHESGLLDVPGNFQAGCGNTPGCDNPRPGYTQRMLWDGVRDAALLWQPGTRWLYSNWGFALLGDILANQVEPTGFDDPPAYESVIGDAFLTPLGMSSTLLGTGANLAVPYTRDQAPTWYWDNTNAFSGAGGLVSDATDMGAWVAAHLGYNTAGAPLGVQALADTLQQIGTVTTQCGPPTDCFPSNLQTGLAWQLYPADRDGIGAPYAFKDGSTNGSSSDTVLIPTAGVGVTTMANRPPTDVDLAYEIARLLVPTDTPAPSPTPTPVPAAATLPATGIDAPTLSVQAFAAATLLLLGMVLLARRNTRRRSQR